MVEHTTDTASPDALSAFIAQQRGPLMAGQEWAVLHALDAMRGELDNLLGVLNEEERRDYVGLQNAWIAAQQAMEQAIRQLTSEFERHALASLRAELKTLTGQDIDPTVAKINTRYLKPSGRVRREFKGDEEKVARVTLWDAACMNYDGLTGWSYPGRVGLAEASYLDSGINATASQFIALVRRLDIGAQLKERLADALRPNGSLGSSTMALAKAEFEFALIEALRNTTASRVDRDKYQHVKRALTGAARWDVVEEMLLFIPHGVDNVSWVARDIGLVGQHYRPPSGDSLGIGHIVFSVRGCKGAFSFVPNHPGGSLRHYDSHLEACVEFYTLFYQLYNKGQVDWLYQIMQLRDCARLKQIVKNTPLPSDAVWLQKLVDSLAQSIPTISLVEKVGYVRKSVQKTPVSSLNDCYIKRSRANLQELANETPGFLPTLIEFLQTLITEILDVLLIPVPGALKGLGRIRAFAMFYAMEQTLVEGGKQAVLGEPDEMLQGFADLADLLISGRLHTRLGKSVLRRHQPLYRQLSQRHGPPSDHPRLANPQVLERMLGTQGTPSRELEVVLDSSATSRHALNQIWEGAYPSASLVEAVHRFRADRLIDWMSDGADPSRPAPVGAVEVMAPLLVGLESWPVGTSLSIENHQGQEMRRYSKDARRPETTVVTVAVQENHQFAYATPRRYTAHLSHAIVALLPAIFTAGEQPLRQQLAAQAKALRLELFDALTRFSHVSRAVAGDASPSVRRLLPDSVGHDQAVPAVLKELQTLHPDLSQARVLEVLREHPLSEHQQTQLLESQLQPEALYTALRAARQAARREALVDGIFHPRRFNRQTQQWAAEFAHGVLRDGIGQSLVVSPAAQAVPYVSRGATDRTVVVIDQGQGRFAPFEHRENRTGATLSGADSFYEAILSQLAEADLLRLGLNALRAISDLRDQVARGLLHCRAPDGSFYPWQREIERYVSTVETSLIDPEPDAQGLYRLGRDRYLFIEGEYFKVAEQPWRIQHPSLNDAYAPLLTHNGAGAWRHEWENPLTWDGQKPFHRLGPLVRGLSANSIEVIQQISGVTPDILRRMHVCNERPPAVLLETIERFTIHQRVKTGVSVGRDFFDELLGEVGPANADALVGREGLGRVEQVNELGNKVEQDRPRMERLFFKALCHKYAQSADPLAQVLQRDFPGLTAAIAEDLVRDLTASERSSLQEGRVPLTKTRAIRWWLEYLRKIRAVEGVHLPAAASEDSARLILGTLWDIDGWPKHLRVEVWDRGRLVDSNGPADGALKRVLEPIGEYYQAYIPQAAGGQQPTGTPGAFLAVMLDALPASERQALSFTLDELTQEIGHRLERKWEFAETQLQIGRRPWYIPPRRLADGRIGYPLSAGDELGAVRRDQVARLRQLFPAKTDEQALGVLERLSGSVRERDDAINDLFKERDALNAKLERWCLLAAPADLRPQLEASERIRRCWRLESSTRGVSYELNLDDLALNDLPQLGAYFGHIKTMSLKNNQLTAIPAAFLRCFPQLRWIFLDGNRLEHLPLGLAQLPSLSLLNLSNNQLKFRLGDVIRLSEMTSLVKLDLSNNPLRLGQRLNLYPLKQLRVLKLRNTQLESLPRGATTLRLLERFDLRDNRISVLTRDDFFIFPNVYRAMDLQGNPLSQSSLQLMRHYRERPGHSDIHFGLNTGAAGILENALPDRWLAVLPVSEVPRHQEQWELLQQRPMSDQFFALLARLAAHPPLTTPGYRALREDLTRRVWQLIESANNNEQLALTLFQHRFEFNRGMDGLQLSLNSLELAFLPVELLALGEGADAKPLLSYFRALSRFNALFEIVLRYDANQTWALASSRILAYRIALSQSLDLPLGFDERLDRAMGVPRAESIASMRSLLLTLEAQIDWPARLVQEAYWVQFLERKYRARFESVLGKHDQSLEHALAQVESGAISEGAYLVRARDIQSLRKIDEDNLIAQLTRDEWVDFGID